MPLFVWMTNLIVVDVAVVVVIVVVAVDVNVFVVVDPRNLPLTFG